MSERNSSRTERHYRGDAPPPMAIGADVWPGLAKLAEEDGELQQVIGKLMAYPDGEDHPDGAGSLRDRLFDEAADVTAAIMYVRAHNAHDRQRFADRVEMKFERFQRWDGEERS